LVANSLDVRTDGSEDVLFSLARIFRLLGDEGGVMRPPTDIENGFFNGLPGERDPSDGLQDEEDEDNEDLDNPRSDTHCLS